MKKLSHLLESNKRWSEGIRAKQADFFKKLSAQQSPQYLWIGCSDSRVPANQIVELPPGQVFVHRNIANVVVHSDLNCLSVIQYAVEYLKIKHIIVCGHYGCGGVQAALQKTELGLMDNWLLHIRDVVEKHREELGAIDQEQLRLNRLCELNVIEQVSNVCKSSVVQGAWRRGEELSVHGWIYGIHDGLLKDLGVCVTSLVEMETTLFRS